jgi:hypothetical protein
MPPSYNAGNGISDRSQAQVLEESACDISTNRTADKLYDQWQAVHDPF